MGEPCGIHDKAKRKFRKYTRTPGVSDTASSDRELEGAFRSIVDYRAAALLVVADPFFFQSSDHLIALGARYHIPTIFWTGEIVATGGLMSYGASISDAFRLAGTYAGRILKGAKPA